MLVLTRKVEESIVIGDEVEVKVVDIKGDQVRLGITAPATLSIYRKELYDEIKAENVRAASPSARGLQGLHLFRTVAGKLDS